MRLNKERGVAHAKDWTVNGNDVRGVDFRRFEGVELLSGGPPCQPFSIGGKHLGPKDPRNMWPEALRAVREVRPQAFILENVRGLFRPDFEPYLHYITLQLTYPDLSARPDEFWEAHLARLQNHATSKSGREIEYRVLSRAINAADYGAPQKRHRAIFVGMAAEFGDAWAFPEATHSQEALSWAKHVDMDYWDRHAIRRLRRPSSRSEEFALARAKSRDEKPTQLPWVTVRDAIADLPRPSRSAKLTGHWQHPGARAYANHTGSCYDEPAKALKAGDHGVPGGENMLINRQGNVRYFTVREMARLQGMPDDYLISGSWKAATRQLGNAVPSMVAECIAQHVMTTLRAKKKANPIKAAA
ncbi:MAG: DNA (cytosine-5-)-methyltransferase [Caulobacteraceae bacterium]|nr:DNA (cytosine-5-)-methyltransferase [Caulobacteraceae bacterium]